MTTNDEVIKSMRAAFSMTKQRCLNPSNRDYKYYGGRGIKICDRWLESFDNFLEDMGVRPEGMTLERKENDKDYCPENCIWAPRSVQSQNTRKAHLIEYDGEVHTIAEWERKLGWKPGVLKARIGRLGYSIEEAFTKPVKCGGLIPNKRYKHLEDQSWRDTTTMREHRLPPKLTEDDVAAMRAMYKALGATFSMLGNLYGVSVTTASNAVQGLAAYEGY